MRDALEQTFGFVTEHNLLVLILMLVVTAGVAFGTTQLQTQSEAGANVSLESDVGQKYEYMQENYGANETERTTQPASVYVRDEGGNALSKSALVASLRYQQSVTKNASVAASLGDRGVLGVANIVAKRAAGSQDATLDEQVAALEATSESEVERLVRSTLSAGSEALVLLPSTYEPGTATAESTRMVFQFGAEAENPRTAATAALYETARERETPELFTTGEHARAAMNDQYMQNTMDLIVPAALLMILLVLSFSYRDLVDVVVGFAGVVLSVLWMFGILGWLQIPAGMTLVIGPVLIVGLSVDYGLHVFMRYREQRGAEENVRDPMVRSLSSVAVALGLVTLTAMVGFMATRSTDWRRSSNSPTGSPSACSRRSSSQELERGRTVQGALLEATTGTGGALLGSTLTSAGAFSALLLHPHPQIQSFGTLVVLGMVTSFVVAVFVLPSLITVWARFRHTAPTGSSRATATPLSQDD
ncbi:MAG: MMPL family transporter [Haloarculaceae archaeon]